MMSGSDVEREMERQKRGIEAMRELAVREAEIREENRRQQQAQLDQENLDTMAAMAMQGYISNRALCDYLIGNGPGIARIAYDIAEAMMAERAKRMAAKKEAL